MAELEVAQILSIAICYDITLYEEEFRSKMKTLLYFHPEVPSHKYNQTYNCKQAVQHSSQTRPHLCGKREQIYDNMAEPYEEYNYEIVHVFAELLSAAQSENRKNKRDKNRKKRYDIRG